MAPVNPKKKDADYRCQDCGLVITVKEVTKKEPHMASFCAAIGRCRSSERGGHAEKVFSER